MSTDHLLWCDLETTGLEPYKGCRILEVAFRVTDFDLNPVWDYSKVIHFSRNSASVLKYNDPFVFEMHSKNNLLEECAASDVTCEQVETEVSVYLEKLEANGFSIKNMILAGSSIHFDRKWLEWYMPNIVDKLHYRLMDVSSLYPVVKMLKLQYKPLPKVHRAMADIERSIGELRGILDAIKLNMKPIV